MTIEEAPVEQAGERNESLTAERYRVFAEVDALDLSPKYAELARRVADDTEMLELIDSLPPVQRQVTFVFAVARFLKAPFEHYDGFRTWALEHRKEIHRVAEGRSLQTNDPSRLAPMIPLLAQIPGPLALLEVGASGGLGLYPDRYSYKFGDHPTLHPDDGPSPVLIETAVSPKFPVPTRLPEIVWRGGIDISPVDVRDPDGADWLRALLWPDNERRAKNLDAAIELVSKEPPLVIRGDLNDALPELVRKVPTGATLVIFHSALMAYVTQEKAETFVNTVLALPCYWISSELDEVVPGVQAQGFGSNSAHAFSYVLAMHGMPVARSHPHGAWVAWEDDDRPTQD